MENLNIINVAGLLMDGIDDGLEASMRERLKPDSIRTIAPTPFRSRREHPNDSIARAIGMIQQAMGERQREQEDAEFVLTGRSYGAFIALLAATRMRFENILRAILIEGPLHPEVLVEPPVLLPPLAFCTSHYTKGRDHSRRCGRPSGSQCCPSSPRRF